VAQRTLEWTGDCTKVLIMTQKDMTATAIKAETGLDYKTIAKIRKAPEFKKRMNVVVEKHINRITEYIDPSVEKLSKARKILNDSVPLAIRTFKKVLRSGTPADRVRFEAAKEILHMTGFKPVEVVENRDRFYTPEELNSMLKTIQEIERMKAMVIKSDIPYLVDRSNSRDVDARSSLTDDDSQSIPPNGQDTQST
jgi:hypothetical protein